MRYFLYALLAIICVLLLIALIRTFKIKAKPTNKESAAPFTPEEEQKYAKMLSKMVQVPTVSAKEGEDKSVFYELHAVMKENFPLVFEKLEKIDLNGNLLMHWKGKDSTKEPILLMGHQDVVPAVETTWKHEPFSGDIEDGRVHGRGAMDCKCTVCAEWAAVEELLEEGFVPERDVYLACSTNEEVSGGGVQLIVKYLKDNGIRLACAMDEGGAIVKDVLPGLSTLTAAVGICEKGVGVIKFTAKGNGGHSSTPAKNNPIARLSAFVTDVEKHDPFKTKLTDPVIGMFKNVSPYLSFPLRFVLGNLWLFKPLLFVAMPIISPTTKALVKTTYVFTMSGGSAAHNVIPEEAYVVANIRPSIQQNCEECFEILKKIAAKYDIEAELVMGKSASNVTSLNSEELAYVGQCVKDVFPTHCFTPYMQTGGTDCREMQAVTDNCLRFTPIRMDPQQLAAMHAANENICTDAVAEGVKYYKYWIENHK
jgi:carboxypeptidase PM20D1